MKLLSLPEEHLDIEYISVCLVLEERDMSACRMIL
jgi:hypothetical protein